MEGNEYWWATDTRCSQAARLALANTIDLANVKRVQIKHVTAIPTLEKEIQSHLTVRAPRPKRERTQVGMRRCSRLKQDPS
jgi:hypothetical protein